MPDVIIVSVSGREILSYLDDVARLRIEVFRDYPYLYAGSLEYEQEYLQSYAACDESIFVLALAGGDVVGVSTGLPMLAADEAFQRAYRQCGDDLSKIFYLGESVLLPTHRGCGIGHAFFDEREKQARHCGSTLATFCSVVRSADHPCKPAGYRPHDVFWKKRGYEPNGLRAQLAWEQVDVGGEVENELVFWSRSL
jgi:GNAT superfamily N-acetyltransferase